MISPIQQKPMQSPPIGNTAQMADEPRNAHLAVMDDRQPVVSLDGIRAGRFAQWIPEDPINLRPGGRDFRVLPGLGAIGNLMRNLLQRIIQR